jgi:hypothetical protein
LHRAAVERSRDQPLVKRMFIVIALIADGTQPSDER